MRTRRVIYEDQVAQDLKAIFRWLAESASPLSAIGVVDDIEEFISRLDLASERGMGRDDLRPGLRIIGRGRAVIAFAVDDETVVVLRVFYGGQDWERAFGG